MLRKGSLIQSGALLKPDTRTALDLVKQDYAEPGRAMHIYIDDAHTNDSCAGHAIAVVVKHADG